MAQGLKKILEHFNYEAAKISDGLETFLQTPIRVHSGKSRTVLQRCTTCRRVYLRLALSSPLRLYLLRVQQLLARSLQRHQPQVPQKVRSI